MAVAHSYCLDGAHYLMHLTHHQCACFLEDRIAKYPSGALDGVYESQNAEWAAPLPPGH